MTGLIAMTDPEFYEVSYAINPWMRPDEWRRDPGDWLARARRQWQTLKSHLEAAGLDVVVIPATPGLPDLVFPANAAIVLDGKALVARFRCPERTGEEACFTQFFNSLKDQGQLTEVAHFPVGIRQEGAGDCLWDDTRQCFWAGSGPRSDAQAAQFIASYFEQDVIPLELITDRYYHLDTCFSVLSGGEILYYPEAFSRESRALIDSLVPASMRLPALADEAATFSLNAVTVGQQLFMAPPPPRLAALLSDHGYDCVPLDLSCYILSGGGSFCMTLRLDRQSAVTAAMTSANLASRKGFSRN